MTPDSSPPCDENAFEKMRRILPSLSRARSARDAGPAALELPDEIAFKLTNRCNLRCVHCYQWNDDGHHRDLAPEEQNRDLDFGVVERVFAATRSVRSNVYLWGGEPLVYRDWSRLARLLEEDRRWTTICTNGQLIEARIETLLPISESLELYVAVDGPRAAHDAMRGAGSFDKIMSGVDRLASLRGEGRFRGEISINCVVTVENVNGLVPFIRECEDRGVDSFFVSLPWFLSEETSREMDAYVARENPWPHARPGRRPSWHAYKHRFDPEEIDALIDALAVIAAHPWRLKLRYNPEVGDDEIREFVSGGSRPAQGKTRCLAVKSRLDVMPDGHAVSCKFFPESSVGDLGREDLSEVWRGAPYERVRRVVDGAGLMPVCAKCNLLYSRGV